MSTTLRPPAAAPGPRLAAAAAGPSLLWLATAAGALLLNAPAVWLAPAGALAALLLYRAHPGVALLAAAAAALGAAAAAGPGWVLLGAGLAMLATLPLRADDPAVAAPDDLERQIARCRRTDAATDVVVAVCDAPEAAAALHDALRLSDAGRVVGRELHAALDRTRLDRPAFERRLAAIAPARFGWARFPEDAVTVGALVAHAHPTTGAAASATAMHLAAVPDDAAGAPATAQRTSLS